MQSFHFVLSLNADIGDGTLSGDNPRIPHRRRSPPRQHTPWLLVATKPSLVLSKV
ncbi:hypothetical protein QJS10_CPA02g00665 [Acorus calamus]|uniref:Uncharacterized protein n=1 Tax=Acorus calamus TaxID=4465 RepID=A0AAV9FH55_ACOCL|nr:hypothetical protein QJS10_CPA02g00665 [Acorus calamus]